MTATITPADAYLALLRLDDAEPYGCADCGVTAVLLSESERHVAEARLRDTDVVVKVTVDGDSIDGLVAAAIRYVDYADAEALAARVTAKSEELLRLKLDQAERRAKTAA